MVLIDNWQRFSAAVSRGAHRTTESYILFPVFAIVTMLILWGGTLYVIVIERDNAESAGLALTRELTDTYEAQVVRVLREIDKDFKVIQYAYEQHGEQELLPALERRDLLPSAFVFTVTVFDPQGEIISSTAPDEPVPMDPEQLEFHRESNVLQIFSRERPDGGELKLQFIRRLSSAAGAFAGVVVIEGDAAFFVSSYDANKMGMEGQLGLLGVDGQYRVRRIGDTVTTGDRIVYTRVLEGMDSLETTARIVVSPIDGAVRYLAVRELYDFPVAVLVALLRDEQLAGAVQRARTYLWRAAGGNVLLLLVIGLLWRMSYNLAESRRHETEARIAYAEQVEYLAYHDGLTGLPNRSLFSKLLGQSISQAQRHKRKLAVLFMDLDHFKQINDTLGHDAGDHLLKEVASRLKDCLRESDIVARLGGDEFVVVLPEIDENAYTRTVAHKIIHAVARPFIFSGQEFRVTASIGVSTYPENGLDEQTLTKNADIAMYKVKEGGKNNVQLYSEKLQSESLERMALESSLRNALERKELEVYYQAKRDVVSGRVIGMEALLRWQHPDLGIVAPMKFLQVAEEIGLIIPIGNWVLKTVCEQNIRWQQQGLPQLNMAVNLTANQFFNENLPMDIADILHKTGMESRLLELEISENVLMQNIEKALAALNTLKELGVRIAIDNFGVGYSSLSMLKQFPLDSIKIDRTFIRDISGATDDNTLAQAIVAMGRTLGLTVVAQGVETQEQVDFLRDHACDEVQGFYFNKPMPAEEFSKLFRELPGSVHGYK